MSICVKAPAINDLLPNTPRCLLCYGNQDKLSRYGPLGTSRLLRTGYGYTCRYISVTNILTSLSGSQWSIILCDVLMSPRTMTCLQDEQETNKQTKNQNKT